MSNVSRCDGLDVEPRARQVQMQCQWEYRFNAPSTLFVTVFSPLRPLVAELRGVEHWAVEGSCIEKLAD